MPDKIEKFEDLEVWKEGMRLAVKIYQTLKNSRDFGLKDQMQRSAVSIPSNIAEGYERNSNKEFIRYLHTTGQELIESTRKISAMLAKLILTRTQNF